MVDTNNIPVMGPKMKLTFDGKSADWQPVYDEQGNSTGAISFCSPRGDDKVLKIEVLWVTSDFVLTASDEGRLSKHINRTFRLDIPGPNAQLR